jgi:N-acetylmuramoyl-L-alanine amidase
MKTQFILSKHMLAAMLVFLMLGNVRNAAAQEITGLSNWTLFIDQGHSQTENMGLYNYSEAQKVLRVGLALRSMFLGQTDIDTVYTARMTDQDNITLEGRTALANTLGVDFYYSIHSDAAVSPATNLTLMLYGGWKSNGVLVEKTPQGGGALGAILDFDLTGAMRIGRRGNFADRVFYQGDVDNHANQWPYLHVNRTTNMASLLSEAGFHTNPTQQMLNMNAEWKVLEALSAFRSFLQWHEIDRPEIGVATGIVRDIETGLALNDVTVTIEDKVYVTDGYTSLFNNYSSNPNQLRNGFYFIDSLTPNTTVSVQFSKDNYDTLTVDLDIVSNPNGLTEENLSFLDTMMVSLFPPEVVSVDPADELTELVPGTPLNVRFSRIMDREATEDALSINPPANYSVSWENDFELVIQTTEFAYLQDYTITLDGNKAKNSITEQFLDGDGDGLEGGDYVFQITMSDEDTDAPLLIDFSPTEDTPVRTLRPVIRLVYDELILEQTIQKNTVVLSEGNESEPVSGLVDHQVVNEQSVIHFFPTENLQPGLVYYVTIAGGLSDEFDNLSEEKRFRFYVIDEPIVQSGLIDGFDSGVSDWWGPLQAGQTVGVLAEETSRSFNTDIVNHSVGSTGSMKLSYGWDTGYSGIPYIRQYLPPTASQNGIRFNPTDVLQVYVFGDGSGNKVRLVIRDGLNQLETQQWVTLDWLGWKLISWDLANDQAFPWAGVGGNGILEGSNFYMDGFHVTAGDGAENAGSIYFDHLHFVKKDETQYPVTLFENWQGYEDFTTDLFPWRTVDVDSTITWNPAGFTFPGAGEPYAWKVLNPGATTPPIDVNHPPVDGDKYLVAMMSQKTGEDKWLISQQLRATDITQLSFYAKSIETDNFGPERIKVYISLDDRETFEFNPENFIQLSEGDFIEVPDVWTQYSWFLGNYSGEVYRFAIQYVSEDDYMLMLDKIEVGDAPLYTVNATVTPEGNGTINGMGEYAEGQQVTLTAHPETGYAFARWEDTEGTILSTENPYSFIMPAEEINITAVFETGQYVLTVKTLPTEGGTATGAGTYSFNEQVTVEATAADGYLFTKWTSRQGELLSSEARYTFSMPGNIYEVIAHFELQPVFYSLTLLAEPAEGGIVSGEGEYEEGTQVFISATPSQNYLFVHWTDEDENIINTNDFFSYTIPGSDVTFTAHFSSTVTVEDESIEGARIYPNPASDKLYVSDNPAGIREIVLFNISGEKVLTLIGTRNSIDVSHLPEGLYLVRLTSFEQILYHKIQIIR